MTVLIAATLVCLAVPVYVYAGYPVLLWLLTRLYRRPPATPAQETPSVTLIVSCYNEAAVIEQKLVNCRELDYPEDRLQILFVSDGSDDGTDAIIRRHADDRIRLLRLEGRLGKTLCLNSALEAASGDIVVFSDANAMYEPVAIHHLVRPFSDPDVGYVVGAALYTDGADSASAANENLYWRCEMAIKTMESQLHSVVGGDGAIYAIRRELWEPLQARDINDFVNPLQIVARGYRGVFEPNARCFEETAGSFEREVARKERIVNRSIRGLFRVKATMNPFRTGLFAFEVVSHKLLRWLIPLFLVLGIIGSAALATQGQWFFQAITAITLVMVLLAWLGHSRPDKSRLPVSVSLPYYFLMVNLYSVRGIVKALRGETQVTWNSARAQSDSEGSASIPGSSRLSVAASWWLLGVIGLTLSLGWSYVA